MSDAFGADEAGKGPVFGSMFAAAVAVEDPAALPEDVDDSKRLSPERRETLAERLREDDRVAVGVAEIPPERIDAPETDMNALTVAAQAEALSAVVADGMRGVVDAGDTSEARFARRVADRVDADVDLRAEHGADETHAIVGAASVVAKVERDAQMARYAEEFGAVGSGYPSDPTTRTFLKEWVDERGEVPPFARETWATCEDVLAAAEQSGLGDF
ncbi:ribonuclease HII [Halostella sp. JP-L12]|uniref:ribonuclease HII n=1 Tax=Halostella TaxID=1843185 RepID=UPI000EF7DDFC|nr:MULTISPECIES: ribonuclease HII [Halostella]NHN46928.1 ribonuclease HII [Halostella sp. JP-L12]